MTKIEVTFKIWEICISLLTPLLVLMGGLLITNKLEKSKLDFLKEKEWQVKWADIFLTQATDFNDQISSLICMLFFLQSETDSNRIEEQLEAIELIQKRISEVDWNIRNYAQFSEKFGQQVISTQQLLMDDIRQFRLHKEGDLELFRTRQFEYNSAVRKAHNEILKMNLEHS